LEEFVRSQLHSEVFNRNTWRLALTQTANQANAALGFRVKSGWATAVLITGSIRSPHLFERRAIDLCDPAVPESRQPYHAAMGTLQVDETKVNRLRKVVVLATNSSVTRLLAEYRNAGYLIRSASLIVGSEIDPATITNPHIRAHALEGQLFRTVLQDALQSCGLATTIIVERRLYTRAAKVLKLSEAELRRSATTLGKEVEGPWRADEKCAALAAWMGLA
jgi:hypothetical protein